MILPDGTPGAAAFGPPEQREIYKSQLGRLWRSRDSSRGALDVQIERYAEILSRFNAQLALHPEEPVLFTNANDTNSYILLGATPREMTPVSIVMPYLMPNGEFAADVNLDISYRIGINPDGPVAGLLGDTRRYPNYVPVEHRMTTRIRLPEPVYSTEELQSLRDKRDDTQRETPGAFRTGMKSTALVGRATIQALSNIHYEEIGPPEHEIDDTGKKASPPKPLNPTARVNYMLEEFSGHWLLPESTLDHEARH